MDQADADTVLASQYRAAHEFIVELAERLVDGDRSRVVLVPGNHDINWAVAKRAMQVVSTTDPAFPKDVRAALSTADSIHRWDWKALQLLKIEDSALYKKRTAAFWDFFDEFYAGANGLLKVAREQTANLYSLWDGRIGVAAFDSCHGNDCYAFHGMIPREAIARAQLDLVDQGGFGLLLAVWHHNIEGPPHRVDYMDVDIIRGMVGRGFRLGLYGHQHRADATPMQINLATRETMALVSAGSLCAGAKELPTGTMRGYNVIEINDDLNGARVHFREMSVANLFTPARRTSLGGASFIDLFWDLPPDLAGRPIDLDAQTLTKAIADAEDALKRNCPDECKMLLKPLIAKLPDFGRHLLIEATRQTMDYPLLMELLAHPKTIGELVELADTLILQREFIKAKGAVNIFATPLGMSDPTSRELRARITAAEAMTK